jgi:hypothetical protein
MRRRIGRDLERSLADKSFQVESASRRASLRQSELQNQKGPAARGCRPYQRSLVETRCGSIRSRRQSEAVRTPPRSTNSRGRLALLSSSTRT